MRTATEFGLADPTSRQLLLSVLPWASLALAMLLPAHDAHALDDYRCKIQAVHAPDERKGDSIVHGLRKTWIGSEFSVSRKTGAMVGALRNNYWNEPDVIDRGSAKANSFKAVTTLRPNEGVGPGSAVHVLVVDEFVESPEKPFTFLNGSEVYFGVCKHDVVQTQPR
jgi:hypothetical protein